MKRRKFLLPLSTSLAVLLAAGMANANVPDASGSYKHPIDTPETVKSALDNPDPLVLARSESAENAVGYHQSHRSHYSHMSHRSHYSHYSGY